MMVPKKLAENKFYIVFSLFSPKFLTIFDEEKVYIDYRRLLIFWFHENFKCIFPCSILGSQGGVFEVIKKAN